MELLVCSILVVLTLIGPNVNGRVVEYSPANQPGVAYGQHVGNASNTDADAECVTKCGEGYLEKGIECRIDSGKETTCSCKDETKTFDDGTKSCLDAECLTKCGEDYLWKGVECRIDSGEGATCSCTDESKKFDDGSKSCIEEDECRSKCGYDYESNGVICSIDARINMARCSCKDPMQTFDYSTKKCTEDKCKVKCGKGYEEGRVTCNTFVEDDTLVECSCKDRKQMFDYDKKDCIGDCKETCGDDYEAANITCKEDPKSATLVTCSCNDPKHLFDYDTRKCKDPCTRNPCKNGGKCWIYEYDRGITKCNCSKPYFGATCEEDPCSRMSCMNGGKCFFLKTTGRAKCDCIEPYFGNNCEIKKITCDDARAFEACRRMQAACVVDAASLEGYRCVCDFGYFEKNGVCTRDDKDREIVVESLSPNVIGWVLLLIVIFLLLCVGFCNIRMNQKLKTALNSLPGVK